MPPAVGGGAERHGVGALEDPQVQRVYEGAELACALPGQCVDRQFQEVPVLRRFGAAFRDSAPVGERRGEPVLRGACDGGPAHEGLFDDAGAEPGSFQADDLGLGGAGEPADRRVAVGRGEAPEVGPEGAGAPTRHGPFGGES